MARFDDCLDEVLRHEGGYVDHPSDPGGATNMGITRKTLARWRKMSPWWNLPKAAVRTLTRVEAAQIYRAQYWDQTRCSSVPKGLDLALFDFAVNSGPDRAIRTLQTELGVTIDGRIGPLTIAAIDKRVNARGAGSLIDAYCARRMSFLNQLKSFAVFGKGWTNRITSIRKAALAAADGASFIPSKTDTWSTTMDFLNGYKTYIVAIFMLLAGLAQMLGLDLPPLDGASSGQMMMEALAILFLRKGLKGDISRA